MDKRPTFPHSPSVQADTVIGDALPGEAPGNAGKDPIDVPTVMQEEVRGRQSRTGKYLVFQLAKEEFGVHVMKVREIMGLQDITAVPQTPAYVKGVINLRGKVVPVIDLRAKFLLPEAEYTQRTCVVVLQVAAGSASLLMGVIVDGVSEVLNLQESEVEDTPEFGGGATVPYILGLAKVKGKVKILLDIDEVLNMQDVAGLDSMGLGQ